MYEIIRFLYHYTKVKHAIYKNAIKCFRFFSALADHFLKIVARICTYLSGAKMVMFNVLCMIVVLFSVVNGATEVTQCKGTAKFKPVITEGFLGDCTTPPCPFKRGEKTWINMTFTTDDDHIKLSNNIYATMMGIKHGYPGLNGIPACTYITPSCPLKKGESYKFAIELDVKKNFPKVSVPLHFAIKDDASGREVACVECMIKIV